ncbi:hypothetical protein MMC22_000523 [Lobaria immixta]|nr:hypothetical protein [Lobaria immixta]
MPRNPKYDKTGEIVRPTIELRPWVRDLHAWLKAPSGNGAGKDPPQTSLASSSRRELSQREVVANTKVEAKNSSSDSSCSAGSSPGSSGEEVLREAPQGVSSGRTTTEDTAPRSAMRASRPSPWRRYLERVVEAKIREYFETQAGRGGAAEMRAVEGCDDAKGMNHDGEGNNIEGTENNEVEQDLEAGIYQPHVDPATETVCESSKRSDAGEDKFRSMAKDLTEQGKPPFGPEVQGHIKRSVDDNFREVKLRKKYRGKNTKSRKNGLAQQVLNWLVFDGPPSSPMQAQKRSYKPHESSRDHRIDRERGIERSKGQGKNRERSIDDKTPPENDDLAWNSPSQSPSHRARHGRQMDHLGVRAVPALDSPRAKTSLARDLARWILGSQKSLSEPAQKRQGRHLSYATTHGTSMQRVERLLRQGLEVERGLEAAYHDLPGKKRKEKGGKKVMESTKVKIGKMVLRYLIGEGEKGIRDAENRNWGEAGGERLRGRSRVRKEDFDEGSSTGQKTEKHDEGHRSDRNSGDMLVRSDSAHSPISSLPSDSHHLPSQLPPGKQLTSSRAREQQPSLKPQPKQKTYHVPLPTDSESSG